MFVERISAWGEATFAAPANPVVLDATASALGAPLPDQLRELLAEANGIEGEYGLGLLWPAERVAKDNERFRTSEDFRQLYMPFDGIVFFADAGNGDQFGIALSGSQEVFVWNHEDDSRMWVAPTILKYLEEWMTGRLTV